MNVFLLNPIKLQFEVNEKFLQRYPFVRTPIDYECFHNFYDNDLLTIDIDSIFKAGILDGPNGVIGSLSEKDGSFAGSIPHDVIWEFVKQLAELWHVDFCIVRKFGDELYTNMVFAYGGRTLWTRLANRFCYRVAFPFGNFLKDHGMKLPHYAAPLIVLALFPIALWMFLFNKNYCKLNVIDPPEISLNIDSKKTKKHLVLKPV